MFKRISLYLLAYVLILTVGCEKPDNGEAFEDVVPWSKILFVNVLSEDAQFEVDFYADGVLYTPGSVAFGQPSNQYMEISPRTHNFAVKKSTDFIKQENIEIKSGKHYTMFLTGTRAKPELKLVEDDFTMEAGTAACSFVHMAKNLGFVKLQNHYPIEPYHGWIATDSLIVNYLKAAPMGTVFHTGSVQFYAKHAEELSDILVRASNAHGDIPYTNNNKVRMPLVVNEFGGMVLYPDTTQPTGFNLMSYSKSARL